MTDPAGIDPGDLVFLGRVEKPHGLKGALSVRLFSGHGRPAFSPGTELHLEGKGAVTVVRCTERGDSRYSLTFREIRSREEAEGFRNAALSIDRSEASEKLDFIPLSSFPGFTIVSRGREMKVVGTEASGANPMLLVENDGKLFHVPIIMAMALGSVDWESMTIKLDLPEGLEDLTI